MRRKHEGIFGTPVGPLFNEGSHKLSAEMLEDCLVKLAEENRKNMTLKKSKQNYFKHDSAAEFVFLACEKFKLPEEARFLALEIFDKFMCKHIEELHKHVQNTSSKLKVRDWRMIQDRVKNQIMLRAVSSCQLASKITSHYKVVTPSSAKRFLEQVGQIYSLESILQSELRVLKTLEYRVLLLSPLVFVETLLETLGHNQSGLAVNMYYSACLKILDLYYIQRKPVYNKLFLVATGCSYETVSEDIKNQYSVVECDHLLLSTAVISAASHVVDPANTTLISDLMGTRDQSLVFAIKTPGLLTVIHQLADISRIPTDDIVDFATVLVHLIVEGNEQ